MRIRRFAIAFINYVIVTLMLSSVLSIAASLPNQLSYPSPQTSIAYNRITPIKPTVQGSLSSYVVSPALPQGLILNSTTGEITGIPTRPQALTQYTVTASSNTGSISSALLISVGTVTKSPIEILRIVAAGTPVSVAMSIAPTNMAFSGIFAARVTDPTGIFLPTVSSVRLPDGSYSLDLTISPSAPVGYHRQNITLNLCSNTACTVFQKVPSISIPIYINIISDTSAWLGNHLTNKGLFQGIPDWTTYQGNNAHTGYVPVTLDPNRFSTRWQGPTMPSSGYFYGSWNTLVTERGRLFIPNANSPSPTLNAYREFDGSLIWSYDFSGLPYPSVNPPAVANGVVYVAAGQQSSTYMFALRSSDGSPVFKSQMSSQWENYLPPTVGPKGVYTNAGTYGGMYGFDFTGQQLFFANLPQTSMWSPAADADHVYTYMDNGLNVFDPVTGALQKSIPDPTFTNYIYEIGGSLVLGAPGSVFAADYANAFLNGGGIGNTLMRFDLTNNSIAWKISGVYPNTPAYHAGILYAVNNIPLRLEARSETTGGLIWSWTPPQAGDTTFVSEVLLTDNLAFVSTNLAVYAIDLIKHKTVWSYPLAGRLALSKSGFLYIQDSDKPLTAINVM